jgi:predicted histone-like DNA-binding protein
MAKIIYEVYQNKNEHTAAYGKFYARVKNLESLNTRKLANHISEHGSIYTPDVVYGVLEKFRSCLLEMLLNSKKVKIEGLGTFYTTIECAKGGALTKDKFSVNKDIKGLHIRFLPEQEQEQNISSREFLKQAEFINVESLVKSDEDNGTTGNGSTENGGSQNQGGGSNGGGTGTVTPDNGGSQNSGSQNQGGNSGSGSNTGGNSGSQSGNTGGNSGSQSGTEGDYRLVIYKYGNGTSTVTDDSEQEINSNDNVHSGSNVNVSVVSASELEPIVKVNGVRITLTENDGTYTGSFQMPTKGTVLEINSETDEMDFMDQD